MFLTFWYAFFDTNLILWQHPQQFFYDLKNPFLKIFGKLIIFFKFLVFLHHPSKFGEFSLKIGGEIICQSWPLLTPFFNFRIVQWLLNIEKKLVFEITFTRLTSNHFNFYIFTNQANSYYFNLRIFMHQTEGINTAI